jgi:hypothetical protein
MSQVLGFANQLPMSIKLAWMFWLAWTLIQAGWFQRARVMAPIKAQPLPSPARRRVERDPAASSPYDVPKPPLVSASGPAIAMEADMPPTLGGAH